MATPGVDPSAVSTRAEFAAAFSHVRESAGLSVRELARRLKVPAGTLGDYFGGRHVPSVGQQGVIEAALRECGVPDEAIGEWLDALRRVRRSSDGRTTPRRAPYQGLERFEPEDADLFFGRADLTTDIVERLARLAADPGPSGGVLAVVGPSGSGKSSVLRAGVVAAVREGALGEGWTCRIATPAGDHLLEHGALPPRDEPGRRVLVLDQFEEVFTYGAADPATPGARTRLLECLTTPGPVGAHDLVVLGMRADFYAEAAREPVLLAALQHAQVVVGPMTEDDVRAAIIGPAEHVGMTVDDGVVELVLADADPHDASGAPHDVGALPLLSHALLATWERSTGRRMTVADYRATGGLDGAIQRTAEQLYTELTASEREVARRLFLRLVHLDGDTAVTRRRASLEELEALAGGGSEGDQTDASARAVLERFVDHRLVTLSATSVEISHEALLGAWPRLRSWVDADRAGLRLHHRLTDTANTWVDAGRDPSLLLRDARVEAAAEWAAEARNRDSLNDVERELLAASLAARDRERMTARRRTRRLTQLLAAVAVLAVVATVLAVLARRAQHRADQATTDARISRDEARSRQLAIQARQLAGTDPALAQQLAVAAYRISPTVEARSELLDSSTTPVITRQLGSDGPTALAVRGDGRLLAVGDARDGSVRLRRADGTMTQVARLPGHADQQLYALTFSPDGRLLAAGGQDRTVTLWDVHSPTAPRQVAAVTPHFAQGTESLAFTPDGRELLAAGTGPLRGWDVTDPTHPHPVATPPGLASALGVQSVDVARGGRLAAGTLDDRVLVWPGVHARSAPESLPVPAGVNVVRFSADGSRLAAGDRSGAVTVWSIAGPRAVLLRRAANASGGAVNALAWTGDGRTLAVGAADNSVQTLDTRTWTQQSSTPNPGPVTGVALADRDTRVVATAADGAVRSWALSGPGYQVPDGSVFTVGFSRSGRVLLVARNGPDGGVQLWRTGSRPAPDGPLMQVTAASPDDGTGALRPDGGVAAAGNATGQVALWRTAPTPARAGPPFAATSSLVESLGISPDGRLLAVGADDMSVGLWSITDPAHPALDSRVYTHNLVLNVAFSPDGRLLAAASADNDVYVWNIRSPQHPRLVARLGGFTSYVYGVAFSPDGHLLAGASSDRTVRLWSVAGDARVTRLGAPLTGPADYANVPTFSPDGHLLAAPSNDHSVWVWDVSHPSAPRRYAQLQALTGNVFTAAFSPDGRTLVAGGRSTDVPAWTVDPARAMTRECTAAGAPVTRAEWAQYVPGVAYAPPCR